MEIDFAILAESAEALNGKVYLLGGGFDTINAKKVPIVYPKMSFVLKIIFEAAEIGREHKLEIQIMDEDGKNIIGITGNLKIAGKSPEHPKGWKQSMVTVINLANLKFSKFGNYSINVVINNSVLKSVPLRVFEKVDILQFPTI